MGCRPRCRWHWYGFFRLVSIVVMRMFVMNGFFCRVTVCGRGDPFYHFARYSAGGGDPTYGNTSVVLQFEVAGACWGPRTCTTTKTNRPFVATIDSTATALWSGALAGILDHTSASNPVKNYHHVYVPIW